MATREHRNEGRAWAVPASGPPGSPMAITCHHLASSTGIRRRDTHPAAQTPVLAHLRARQMRRRNFPIGQPVFLISPGGTAFRLAAVVACTRAVAVCSRCAKVSCAFCRKQVPRRDMLCAACRRGSQPVLVGAGHASTSGESAGNCWIHGLRQIQVGNRGGQSGRGRGGECGCHASASNGASTGRAVR